MIIRILVSKRTRDIFNTRIHSTDHKRKETKASHLLLFTRVKDDILRESIYRRISSSFTFIGNTYFFITHF